jgi:uncharacterized protein YcsI (UPF0317 family)
MKTLTFEQLRINLTLTFDTLDEPIQIIKKGKIQGYIVKSLRPDIPENDKKQSSISLPGVKIVPVELPCEPDIGKDTIYEPDSVKPVKIKRRSVSKAVAPVVSSLLSTVKARPTVSHHPTCKCGMCLIYKQP